MSITYLKIKMKSLAAEARIIRAEEQRQKRIQRKIRNKFANHTTRTKLNKFGQEYEHKVFSDPVQFSSNEGRQYYDEVERIYRELQIHRWRPVGTEYRAAALAYGFLRGKSFESLERMPTKSGKIWYHPEWVRVIDLVTKYGPEKDREKNVIALRKWSGYEIVQLERN
jgi:hypothetical protein